MLTDLGVAVGRMLVALLKQPEHVVRYAGLATAAAGLVVVLLARG